jgi:hypothetical protein
VRRRSERKRFLVSLLEDRPSEMLPKPRRLLSEMLSREKVIFRFSPASVGNRGFIATRERAVFSSRNRTPRNARDRKCAALWDKKQQATFALA